MKTVKIRKGWWYGAGSVFGWRRVDPQLHQFGVGISMEMLKSTDKIKVEVAGEKFFLDTAKALSFVQRFSAYKTIRGKRLGIVSKSILEPVVAN